MTYVDGMICAVPNANRKAFVEHANLMASIFKEYGAQRVVDCWGVDVPSGEVTSLPMAVKCKDDESVIFSWIVWPSKQVRDEAWPKLMADSRMSPEAHPMPFDGKRMIFGGFETVVDV